jgi:tight adherence protein B
VTTPLNPLIMMAAGGTTVIAAGIWLYAAERRGQAARQRISSVTASHASAGIEVQEVRRPWTEATREANGFYRALGYLAIEPDRPDLYPMPWWAMAFVASMFAVALAAGAVFFVGPMVWVSLPLAVFFVVRTVFKFFHNRRSAQLYAQLPDALAMVVRSVRVGFTVPDALRIVSEEGQWPTSAEFRRVIDEIRVGGSLLDALVKLAHRSALLEYRFLAVALSLQSQSGGSLSETLENLADVVRKRVALKQRAIALAAEAKMTMYVLGCLPFVVTAGLMVLTPAYLVPLVSTSVGKMVLFAGIVLLCLGFGSMKIIIKKSVS